MTQPRIWKANWIWTLDKTANHPRVLFRKNFDCPAGASGVLHIAVETLARVYLNGQHVLRTSSLSYPGEQNYQSIDLTPHLRAGINQLAIVAWRIGVGCTSTWGKDPGLLCEIELVDKQTTDSIGTDATWRCLPLEAWSGSIRSRMFNLDLTEVLDYRKLPRGFPFPDDESNFQAPDVLPWPGVRMGVVTPCDFSAPVATGKDRVRPIAMHRVVDQSRNHPVAALAVSHESLLEPLPASDVIPVPPSDHATTIVYSLDGYHIGHPQITLDAPQGTIVDLSWCETLTDGHFDARPIHPWTTDRHTLAEGISTITCDEWKAGRFLQLTVRHHARPVRLHDVRFVREQYPLNHRIKLRSSDPLLNDIFKIGLRSAHLCMHDRIMDCPWRERRQWIGDVQRIALVNYYAFDDRKLIRHALRQQARLQDPSGRIWVCIPLMEEYPTQSMEWVRAIIEYEHYTGDTTLVNELADQIEWLHRWFLKCRDNRGLFFNPHRPVQNWMDNPLQKMVRDHQFSTAFLSSNLRYLMFLDDVAGLLTRCGHSQSAERAKDERAQIASRIVQTFQDGSTKLLRECADATLPIVFSEYGAALACLAGLPDFAFEQHWDRYQTRVDQHDSRTVASSPFGKYQTFEALGRMGRHTDILREIRAGWGPMVQAGSDTAWESFTGNSQCHGWSGVPVVAVLRHLLKIDPRTPKSTQVEHVAGVDWFEITV